MPGPIMYATDFSPASRPAFTKALELARKQKTGLVIVHVMSAAVWAGDGYVSPATYDEIYRGYRADAQKKLDAAVAKAKAAGVRARGLLLEGMAAAQILRAATSVKPALLVLGTHGRTGVARFFVGSVAGRVVAGATCPVVTVRGK